MAGRRVWATGLEVVAWWLLLLAGYLQLISTVSPADVVAGAVISGLAAVAAVGARRATQSTWQPTTAVRLLAYVPGSVLADTWRLVPVLWAEVFRRGEMPGRVREVALTSPADPAAEHTRTAVAAVTMSMSPGTYVIDTRRGSLLIHTLRDEPDRLERAVQR